MLPEEGTGFGFNALGLDCSFRSWRVEVRRSLMVDSSQVSSLRSIQKSSATSSVPLSVSSKVPQH